MDSMDIKGIAWVGKMYQKFEAMCLEVEEAVCQETAKYVENQVQTVGASMKRFCSDVMQDLLLPPSKDFSRVSGTDLLLNPYLELRVHKKSMSSTKEDAIDCVPVKVINDDKSNLSNAAWEDWSAASINWEISDKDEAKCERMTSEKSLECEFRGEQDIRAECTDTSETRGSVFQMGSQATSNTSSCQSIDGEVSHSDTSETRGSAFQMGSQATFNTSSCQSIDGEVSHSGSSAKCNPDSEMENENDTSVQMVEPLGYEPGSRFEETCVLVDENDYRPGSCTEEIRRSYKKKIQSAFSSKKKSARKQEYKQLAARHANCHEVNPFACSLSENTKVKKLATNGSLDSEWELL